MEFDRVCGGLPAAITNSIIKITRIIDVCGMSLRVLLNVGGVSDDIIDGYRFHNVISIPPLLRIVDCSRIGISLCPTLVDSGLRPRISRNVNLIVVRILSGHTNPNRHVRKT